MVFVLRSRRQLSVLLFTVFVYLTLMTGAHVICYVGAHAWQNKMLADGTLGAVAPGMTQACVVPFNDVASDLFRYINFTIKQDQFCITSRLREQMGMTRFIFACNTGSSCWCLAIC